MKYLSCAVYLLLCLGLSSAADTAPENNGFNIVVEHAKVDSLEDLLPKETDQPTALAEFELPEKLNMDTFDKELKSNYHFVEFFSPYCGHCQHLAPIWKQFFIDNHLKYESQSIYMRQVDCVASGDLCERESILYYPLLRFYGPGGKLISSFSLSDYTKDADGFERYLEDQLLELGEDDKNGMTKESLKALNKKNRMVQTPELLDIVGGLNEKPVLLSFWPSSDLEFNSKNFHNDFKQVELFKECPRCFDFRNIWSKVLKNLASEVNANEIEFGYVNCLSNQKICSSLGMDDLVRGDPADYDPRLFMFLPSDMEDC
ncbi:unnamed protein product [Ambrosiozyma monospora]|uniref:Unnamed protein product n=1 Tax=Ambrosiozyma monospora TaxID=43982 RepID=A0A9W7DMZ4_AMBMO|nr:unnamed protein product [Ambrosiozyma monospora]